MLDHNLVSKIETALTHLIGQDVREIGRAANMLWIAFGQDVVCVNYKSEKSIKSRYALHVQCNWEFFSGHEVFLSQKHFCVPKSGIASCIFDTEPFGNSMFDEITSKFNHELKVNPVVVADFDVCGLTGKLLLRFSNGYSIGIFTDKPEDGESWRFFEPGSDKEHLVLFDD